MLYTESVSPSSEAFRKSTAASLRHLGFRLILATGLIFRTPAYAAESVAAPTTTSTVAATQPTSNAGVAQGTGSLALAMDSRFSVYERDVLSRVLAQRQEALEEHPDGKWIEDVEVEALDVFTPEDPLPGWLNLWHTTSRAAVIEREILLRRGQRYSSALVEESARNLRGLRQLSLVLAVPVKGTQADRVRVLVVTKDVWSLRLNSAFRLKNRSIEYLQLQLSEENLLGQHLKLATQYAYSMAANSYGLTVSHQRLFGSRIALIAAVNAIEQRSTHEFEGSSGLFYFGQPLYSTRAKWSWGTSLAWSHRIFRHLLPNASGDYEYRRFDDPSTTLDENVPYRYRARQLGWRTFVTRAFGHAVKQQTTLGMEATQRKFDARNLLGDGYSTEAVNRFEERVLERSTTSLGPFAQFEVFRNRYVSLFDVETLGLQEDYPTGPRAFLKAYSASKRAMSSRDFVGLSTGLEYTASFAGALGRIWAIHTSEASPERGDSDGLVQGGLRLMTSPTGLGRFVYDAGGLYRYLDHRHLQYALGGDNRLRGYPSSQFLGRHLVTSNLEFRTRSIKLFEVLFGLVGFYDVGDAFNVPAEFAPKHSVGLGARATAPQLQRVAARLDVAVPLTVPRPALSERWAGIDVLFTLSGQAFPFPTPAPSSQGTPLLSAD